MDWRLKVRYFSSSFSSNSSNCTITMNLSVTSLDGKFRWLITLLLILTAAVTLQAADTKIKGKVTDKNTGTALPYASLRIAGTATGTATNSAGEFELKLKNGEYILISSFMGYKTDSTRITVPGSGAITITLLPSQVSLPEITVFPGENPAMAIIRGAVQRKKARASQLSNYTYSAYTKSVILSTEHIDMRGGGFSVSLGVADSIPLSIGAIAETKSTGYFRTPSDYTEEIIARKQTANIPSFVNTLTGGRLVQNFYAERINFFGQQLYGPLSDEALRYYYYSLSDTLAQGNSNVFVINIIPDDTLTPGFTGKLFIQDKSFHLLKVELNLNRAANTGGFLDTVTIIQQFAPYADSLFMPADYRLMLKANLMGLARVGYELASVMSDYKINTDIPSDKFGKTVVRVLPDADKKDSSFWNAEQVIPLTKDELLAYKELDSLRFLPTNIFDKFSFFSSKLDLSEYVSVSAPLDIYRFNKVTGHALNYALDFKNLIDYRLASAAAVGYGFGSKKLNYTLGGEYRGGDLRTNVLTAKVFNETRPLYAEKTDVGSLIGTLTNILTKSEFADYYYTAGALLSYATEVSQELKVGLGFSYADEKTAKNNSSFSIINASRSYKDNPAITDARTALLSLTADFDLRNIIEDGKFRRRTGTGSNYLLMSTRFFISDNRLFKSDKNFSGIEFSFNGALSTFRRSRLTYAISTGFTGGDLPVQNRYLLPGNINLVSRENTFRTLPPGNYSSEKQVAIFLEHNLRDELFLASGVSWLQKSEIQLTHYLNAGWSENKDNSAQFRTPLIETGFLLSHIVVPIKLDIGFRLTHINENAFRIGFRVF